MIDSHTAPEFNASALVLIDTQCDVLQDGAFPISGTSDALPAMRRLLEAFRQAGRPIVHVVRLYEPDGSNADLCRRGLLAGGGQVLVPDSPGCQIPAELLPRPGLRLDIEQLMAGGTQPLGPGEAAMYKPRWGAFYATPLEQHLRDQGITTIVFAGCNFPNCPRTSIYEASERDFRTVVARDAISGLYDRGEHELLNIGVQLLNVAELTVRLEALAQLRAAARTAAA